MEAQVTNDTAVQTPATVEKKSILKRIPKWAIYSTLALIVAVLLGFGYTQHWFKFAKIGTTEQANDVVSTVAPEPTAAAGAPEDTLLKARQAFAMGNVQGAINGYREILAKNPNDIGAMGELGNVLYMAGWIPQATQTYFEAATKAIEQNRTDVAEALLPVIMRSNPMLASELSNRLFDVQVRQDEAAFDTEHRS